MDKEQASHVEEYKPRTLDERLEQITKDIAEIYKFSEEQTYRLGTTKNHLSVQKEKEQEEEEMVRLSYNIGWLSDCVLALLNEVQPLLRYHEEKNSLESLV